MSNELAGCRDSIAWLARGLQRGKKRPVVGGNPLLATDHGTPITQNERADKPGSVVDAHLSTVPIARDLQRPLPGRSAGSFIPPLCGLAPGGACQAGVSPRRWWSLTPPFQLCSLRGVFFSVALSVSRLLGTLAASERPALWSPDFPPRRIGATTWLVRLNSTPPAGAGQLFQHENTKAGKARRKRRCKLLLFPLSLHFVFSC